MPIVDLRSDTVTKPTPRMLEAMQSAELGDDVLGDDPTVAELEALAAKMTGHAAAVFVPSGTMGNQIAIASHTSPGDAILCEEEAHILYYEVGAPAVLSGVVTLTLPSDHGVLDSDTVERRVTKANLHTPGSTLLCFENSHNRGGGTVTNVARTQALREVADRHGMKLHMDGARVFNSAVALGVDIKELTAPCDSVSFCLSKGLRSPIGSVLVGAPEFIDRARVWRKRLGGGMRQAGLLAACGIESLTNEVSRLAIDHDRAKRLATGIARTGRFFVDLDRVETNIVLVQTPGPAPGFVRALEPLGVRCFPAAADRIRLVTHADLTDAGIEQAIQAFAALSAVTESKV